MKSLSLPAMLGYLGRSIRSLNANKLNGMLAEVAFRGHVAKLGFGDRVSEGGWLVRSVGANSFAQHAFALFPETIEPSSDYSASRVPSPPSAGLHDVAAVFRQIGIPAYFCQPMLDLDGDPQSLRWTAMRLGHGGTSARVPLQEAVVPPLIPRGRRHNFLAGKSDASRLPSVAVPVEFSKEHLRVSLQSLAQVECSDVDGILFGKQYTYPIEIKEKTAASMPRMGEYFGIDAGPFVKLAYYASQHGHMHSLFVVHEIADRETRASIQWWFVTFRDLARFASWVPLGGGQSMGGGSSTVIAVPRSVFRVFDESALNSL